MQRESGRHAFGEDMTIQDPVKDECAAHPIANAWRATLRDIVRAFVDGDFALTQGVRSVAPVPAATANQVRKYISSYGETLSELPEETWDASISQWMGTHWDVLVDLWTVESGRSDMVLSVRIYESDGDGFRVEVDSVHVP